MGGWSMGWDVKDAHQSIHDDGRTLRPVREDEYLHTYDEYGLLVPGGDVLPSYARPAFLFRGNELISGNPARSR